MKSNRLTLLEAFALLERKVSEAGSARKFATAHGMTPSYVSQVLSGKLPMSDRLLSVIGIRRVVEFERVR